MTGRRICWVDATGGVSGDMLLGACLDAGVPVTAVQEMIDALGLPEPIRIGTETVQRAGLGATRALVDVGASTRLRTLTDIVAVLDTLDAPARRPIRDSAMAVFHALAEAEARAHRVPIEQVHFHEVGALDSIADVVGTVAALHMLGYDQLVCSPIALGGGRAGTEHGPIPVPGPAVLELLRGRGAPSTGGPIATELATPTGVALLTVLADEFGPLPPLTPEAIGVGAGSKDPAEHPNVTRLIIGSAATGTTGGEADPAVVLEANVDDLDPRIWPQVLGLLLEAGASDAWLTPILMKKGRPAHTLSVLARPSRAAALQELIFTHTSTIGLRRRVVEKVALAREWTPVEIYGGQVRVKIARLGGRIVNMTPEYEDVSRLAVDRGLPIRTVLDAANAAARDQLGPVAD